MWFGDSFIWNFGFLFVIVALGFSVQRTDRRTRIMKIRLDRLSLTFLKIETDLAAIQDSLLIMSQANGDEISRTVVGIRDRRRTILKFIVEQGPNSSEILRGLEFPDPADDPAFWATDRMKRFGLDEDSGNDAKDDR